MTVKRERLILTKLWAPQLHLSGHLNVVIKECAHAECNPYFDPISVLDLKKEAY